MLSLPLYLNISVNLPFLRFLFFLCEVFKELSQKLLGGDEENRTPDPLLARQVLSQLSYTPVNQAGDRIFFSHFRFEGTIFITPSKLNNDHALNPD